MAKLSVKKFIQYSKMSQFQIRITLEMFGLEIQLRYFWIGELKNAVSWLEQNM